MNHNQDLKIHLRNFDGPLELLLHLINRSQMDIYDIKINEITEQYMSYLETIKSLNIDSTGDYLVMATELMAIKSKMLLPNDPVDDSESSDDDPRKDLVQKLTVYKKYRKASNELNRLSKERTQKYTRSPVIPNDQNNLLEIGQQLDVDILSKTFNEVIKDKMEHKPLKYNISEWKYSESTQMDLIKRHLVQVKSMEFSELFTYQMDLERLITNFLAILDMTKKNIIKIVQNKDKKLIQINEDVRVK